MKKLLFLILFTFFSFEAYSCMTNLDCNIGSTCLKTSYALYGVCVGGLNPGNKNDNRPVYAPLDIDRTYGNTCQFDYQCGVSNKCVKGFGMINGTCM